MTDNEASQAFLAHSLLSDRLIENIADFGLHAVPASGRALFKALLDVFIELANDNLGHTGT